MEIHWHFFNAPQVTRTRIECPRPRLIFSLNKGEPADRIQSNEDQMMYPVTQFVSMGTVLSMAPGQSPKRPPASVSVSVHLFWTGGWAVPSLPAHAPPYPLVGSAGTLTPWCICSAPQPLPTPSADPEQTTYLSQTCSQYGSALMCRDGLITAQGFLSNYGPLLRSPGCPVPLPSLHLGHCCPHFLFCPKCTPAAPLPSPLRHPDLLTGWVRGPRCREPLVSTFLHPSPPC